MEAKIIINEDGWNLIITYDGERDLDLGIESGTISAECCRQQVAKLVKELQAILRSLPTTKKR